MTKQFGGLSMTQRHFEVYFDESGYTGDDLDETIQSNIVLAAVVFPPEKIDPFWQSAKKAWEIAGRHLNVLPEQVELKGADIYGGKGQFGRLKGQVRLSVIEAVISSLVQHELPIFWDGLPKHLWRQELSTRGKLEKNIPFWKSLLLGFCGELHQLLCIMYPSRVFSVAGDQNCWIKEGRILRLPGRWNQLAEDGIQFYSSTVVHGLQVADVVAHTLYRANRQQLNPEDAQQPEFSNTDRKAQGFHSRLEERGLWVNISEALRKIGGGGRETDLQIQ